jgi:ATP-dependent Clp protease ATP-binding subunit ClpA
MLFNIKAEKILTYAKAEAESHSQGAVHAHDILLGILAHKHSVAALTCEALGITFDTASTHFHSSPLLAALKAYTQAKGIDEYNNVLMLSFEEAANLQDHHIGPEHFLLALTHPQCKTPVLEHLAIERRTVRFALLKTILKPQ